MHYEYCQRRDPSRNLALEAIGCGEVPEPRPVFFEKVPRLTSELRELELLATLRIAGRLRLEVERALEEAMERAEECVRQFGVHAEEGGASFEEDDKTRCCYTRCGWVSASGRSRWCLW